MVDPINFDQYPHCIKTRIAQSEHNVSSGGFSRLGPYSFHPPPHAYAYEIYAHQTGIFFIMGGAGGHCPPPLEF